MTGRPGRLCRAARASLALRYYGALPPGDEESLARHLASCAGCVQEWESLRRLLDGAGPSTVFPRESEVDWGAFARVAVARARAAAAASTATSPSAVQASVGARRRLFPGAFPAAALWAGLAAAVLVVATLGILSRIGRPSPGPGSGAGHPASTDAEMVADQVRASARTIEDSLARRSAARYLSDSRALLMSLSQMTTRCRRTAGDLDISLEAERSRQLLRRKNLYEGDLDGLRDQRLAALLRELEPVLIQVASLQDCAPPSQLRELRKQIEQRQILLRIDLLTRDMQRGSDVV